MDRIIACYFEFISNSSKNNSFHIVRCNQNNNFNVNQYNYMFFLLLIWLEHESSHDINSITLFTYIHTFIICNKNYCYPCRIY